MRYPNVTWRIILYDYLFTTELRHICSTIEDRAGASIFCGSTPEYFWSNAYISNGRRFRKSALRILLLSTFRVSSINYSLAIVDVIPHIGSLSTTLQILACTLPIHTRSSTNTEDCEHTVSRNRVKCCINVRQIAFEKACNRWMTFQVIQSHCRCCHLIGHIRFPISLPL